MVVVGGASSVESDYSGVTGFPLNIITAVGEHCICLGPICNHYTLECVLLHKIFILTVMRKIAVYNRSLIQN